MVGRDHEGHNHEPYDNAKPSKDTSKRNPRVAAPVMDPEAGEGDLPGAEASTEALAAMPQAPGAPVRSKDCAECGEGDNRYYKLWSAPPKLEAAHGVAGVFLHKLGVLGYGLFAIIPIVFVGILHGLIPIGNPGTEDFKDVWVFSLITNPLATALFCFLYTAAFLSAADRERPFRQHILPIAVCVLAQIGVVLPLLLTVGLFNYLGIASFVLFLFVLYIALKLSYPEQSKACDTFFRRFVLLVALYVPILVAYLIAFRESGSILQSLLNFAIAFITFIYRRVMLSKLDPFPLDIAQLFAGLWVQNMYDAVNVCCTVLHRNDGFWTTFFWELCTDSFA